SRDGVTGQPSFGRAEANRYFEGVEPRLAAGEAGQQGIDDRSLPGDGQRGAVGQVLGLGQAPGGSGHGGGGGEQPAHENAAAQDGGHGEPAGLIGRSRGPQHQSHGGGWGDQSERQQTTQ